MKLCATQHMPHGGCQCGQSISVCLPDFLQVCLLRQLLTAFPYQQHLPALQGFLGLCLQAVRCAWFVLLFALMHQPASVCHGNLAASVCHGNLTRQKEPQGCHADLKM